jgi:hypothetical protein
LRAVILATLGAGLLLTSTPVHSQDEYHGGSFNVHQHGYEHGYRDGYTYGRDSRLRNVAPDYRTDAFRDADRGYRPFSPASYTKTSSGQPLIS